MEKGSLRPPIEAVDHPDGDRRWKLDLPEDYRRAFVHLFNELRQLLRDGDPNQPPLLRLFPPVYVDDEEKEAEYRRLMRNDLLRSRFAQLDKAERFFTSNEPGYLNEAQVTALLHSLNAMRVVVGTILNVDDDAEDNEDLNDTPEHRLYTTLEWLLKWTVHSFED